MIGIYKIVNEINGKVYIGQSIHIEQRIKEHFYKAKCEKDISYNSILHQAIRKYGTENFSWEVLEECSVEDIDKKEQYYINKYNSLSPYGYNILKGGQKIRYIPQFCSRCGAQITGQGKTKLCKKCSDIAQRLVINRPSAEELNLLLRQYHFAGVAKMYNISFAAIKKWCKHYNMSTKAKDYK